MDRVTLPLTPVIADVESNVRPAGPVDSIHVFVDAEHSENVLAERFRIATCPVADPQRERIE